MFVANQTSGIALAGATLSLLLAAAPTGAQNVQIGHLTDHSGPTAEVGIPYSQGIEDAIAYVNAKGGIAGKKVDMTTVDYSYQVPRAMAAYKNMSSSVV